MHFGNLLAFHKKECRDNLTQINEYIMDEMITSIKNNISMHFMDHVKNYVKFLLRKNEIKKNARETIKLYENRKTS